jgi:hypothetical protein
LIEVEFYTKMAVTIDQGPHDGPDVIIPANEASPKRSFGEHISHIFKAFTTKDGLVGDYDYGELPHIWECAVVSNQLLQRSCSRRIFPS